MVSETQQDEREHEQLSRDPCPSTTAGAARSRCGPRGPPEGRTPDGTPAPAGSRDVQRSLAGPSQGLWPAHVGLWLVRAHRGRSRLGEGLGGGL